VFGPAGASCWSRALAALCRCPMPCCSCSLEIWPLVWADVRPRFSKKAWLAFRGHVRAQRLQSGRRLLWRVIAGANAHGPQHQRLGIAGCLGAASTKAATDRSRRAAFPRRRPGGACDVLDGRRGGKVVTQCAATGELTSRCSTTADVHPLSAASVHEPRSSATVGCPARDRQGGPTVVVSGRAAVHAYCVVSYAQETQQELPALPQALRGCR
jgi:hypothetical protein